MGVGLVGRFTMANENYFVNLVKKSMQAEEIACIPLEGLNSLISEGKVICLGRYFSQGKHRRLTASDLKPEELICQGHHDTGMGDVCGYRCIENILEGETQERAMGLAKEEAVKKSNLGANVILYSHNATSAPTEITVGLDCLACKYILKKK